MPRTPAVCANPIFAERADALHGSLTGRPLVSVTVRPAADDNVRGSARMWPRSLP